MISPAYVQGIVPGIRYRGYNDTTALGRARKEPVM